MGILGCHIKFFTLKLRDKLIPEDLFVYIYIYLDKDC